MSSTANSSTVSAASASRAGEHQPILRLPYMRFDASPRDLASHWADPTLYRLYSCQYIVIILAVSGTLVPRIRREAA